MKDLFELGQTYYLLGEFEKSKESFTEYLLLRPNDENAYYLLGLSYVNLNKYNFAMDAFFKVISLMKATQILIII